MSRLIDGLLDVSRIARGKIQLERETLDARRIVEALLRDRVSAIEARDLEVRIELPSRPLWVSADPVRLAQVFDNLSGNAIEFSNAGGEIRVTLPSENPRFQCQAGDRDDGRGPVAVDVGAGCPNTQRSNHEDRRPAHPHR
jgi:signal transduction histidine kinase